MMVPRSYLLHQSSSPPSSRRSSEKMGARSPRTIPPTMTKNRIHPQTRKELRDPDMRASESKPSAVVTHTPTSAPHAQSKPVVIPPRTLTKSSTTTQTVSVRGRNGGRSMRTPKNHQSDAVPPAVAALLAVTEIPRMRPRRPRGTTVDRRISMDELIQEWKQEDPELPPSVVGSPLDVLLGRVDESEDEYGSLRSLEQEKDYITSRSISSESITTMPPSLDLDAPSFISNWDSLNTPESYGRPERREKIVQSPPKEDSILDHPLLHFDPDDCEDIELDVEHIATSQPTSADRFKSFKSNLTASFQALKSAAKSFSNFTAPSVPPDDLLTRSLLSPKFPSEMRPKHLEGLPSPALRRYLNPQPTAISAAELSMQLHDSLNMDIDAETNTPMIQMQTYDRRGRSTSRKRRNDPFSEAGRALSSSPAVRQREPRENSDFLRVIVLEMNMRRVGKLDAKAVGRARIWLPPRKPGSGKTSTHLSESEQRIPTRWVAALADDV